MLSDDKEEGSITSLPDKKPFIEPELKSFDELEKLTQGFNPWGEPRAQLIGNFSP
jgi:hypothetical protein